ncbi:LysR family transcriptional regulator ArgP [Nocardia seriolae]|uniref:HTH-type transcriptional regulator ArgP n=1 Tax=Nocardia seriolae TaxID=37332 RepID=A0ABC8AZB1_9NOCA|nr:LysR family transcriptional regulator ArgP [Nocardia seriolae]APA99558.1 HTH-type transcriptional regulator ArgP [Nocardia seriolae]MTJ63062.1 ArgP/LysG family DNA-binding transcriptional regulator [Nocardia seriolae]MTJ73295.1 ArgP/LysG family DNA-binding transcriptional regulator [Nocardia seriolae]MTJ89131.1 ArgP/LysG family DNA-binding transcriptional regulator [Nocardia seriolae]MTK33109.1 ArgP/LysG family DNA-binding transcriptional regulator [Nocardia seriolae]
MDLQLDQLRALDAVISEGTFDAAARKLSVTPSAISQRIKALEDAAGRILVQRTKPVQPTESGLTVLRLARQIQLLTSDTARELGDVHQPADRPVVIPIAVNADSLQTWVIDALGHAAAGGVCLELHREDEEHTTRLLRDGTVMAAITSTAAPVQGCTVRRLGAMRYRPMAAPEFARTWFPDGPNAKSFTHAPVVLFDRKDDLQFRLVRHYTRKPVDPPRHYIPSSAGFNDAVRVGMGWGMIPDIMIRPEDGLVPLDEKVFVDVPLYWQQWKLDSPALSLVAAAIAEGAAQVLL